MMRLHVLISKLWGFLVIDLLNEIIGSDFDDEITKSMQ